MKNKIFLTFIFSSLLSTTIFAGEVEKSDPINQANNPPVQAKSLCEKELDVFKNNYDKVTKSLNEKIFHNESSEFRDIASIFEATVKDKNSLENLKKKYSCENIEPIRLITFNSELHKIFPSDKNNQIYRLSLVINENEESQSEKPKSNRILLGDNSGLISYLKKKDEMSTQITLRHHNGSLFGPKFNSFTPTEAKPKSLKEKCEDNIKIINDFIKIVDQQLNNVATELKKNKNPITQIYTDHLNLLSHLKNEYISKQQKECNYDEFGNFNNYVASCINTGDKRDGLSFLLNNAESLIGHVESERKSLEDAVVLQSCNRLKKDIKELEQTVCSKLDEKIRSRENSASYRYTVKNEIPVFQDNTWKWAKKRTNVELFGAAALQGTTTFMPNWLSLMHTKQSINYEYMRAINIKSNNFYANQFYQNWLKNYYTNPQIFSPQQFNFGQSGGLQNIGYGF